MSLVSTRQWRSRPADEFIFPDWEGDHVVYHRRSGKTHILNDAAYVLIFRILAEPRDLESAATELASRADADVDDEYRRNIEVLILRFEELGLLERVGAITDSSIP